jgi:hypothetical protein
MEQKFLISLRDLRMASKAHFGARIYFKDLLNFYDCREIGTIIGNARE